MSFRKRFMRELHDAYAELVTAAPFILVSLFALALVLFLALLSGVIR